MISTLDEIHSLCPRRSLVSSVNNHRWISKQIFFALLQCNVHVRFTLWTWVYILSSHFWDGQSFLHKQTQNLTITCTNCTFCWAQDKSLNLDSTSADIFTLYHMTTNNHGLVWVDTLWPRDGTAGINLMSLYYTHTQYGEIPPLLLTKISWDYESMWWLKECYWSFSNLFGSL